MAEFPALPIFTDAYLGDTRHLTTAQHGAYFLLLIIAWRTNDCSLPDDDTFLSRCVGMEKRTWLSNKDIIMAFWFKNTSGRWQQKRLLDERNFAEQVRNKNSLAGKASALKRKNRGSTSVQPNPNQNSTPSPSPSPTPRKGRESKASLPIELPLWMPIPEWEAFKEMRKRTKHPLTPYAERLAIGKLGKFIAEGADIVAILNQSILNNWKDLYPLKQQGETYGRPKSKLDIAAESIARAAAEREQGRSG
jgi:uncharacterized protein YdaU (DUF1376 family)